MRKAEVEKKEGRQIAEVGRKRIKPSDVKEQQ
jgi:hypothetical protein